ncbi:hypothetical protein KSP40_PGU022464 [Platanthera guangdongensis]|uniref:Transketolase-like C-terminal domain-containing protein n=1 Tax=Platanthera guangdongensis TaxID=2320717 RepID=A0ABR2N2V0_9ASPA
MESRPPILIRSQSLTRSSLDPRPIAAKAFSTYWDIDRRSRGGYIVSDDSFGNKPNIILVDNGSELEIPVKAAYELRKVGKTVRVVTIVLWELFGQQRDDYMDSVLPKVVTTRVSIKDKTTFRREKFVGTKGTNSKEGRALGVNEKWRRTKLTWMRLKAAQELQAQA